MKTKWSPLTPKQKAELTEFFKQEGESVLPELLILAEGLIADGLSAEQVAEDQVRFFDEAPKQYELQKGELVHYFSDLLRSNTTGSQWKLGRTLVNQLFRHESPPQGRPLEIVDRIYVCTHVDWCIRIQEVGQTAALDLTAERFKYSRDTLESWFNSSKGYAAVERYMAKLLVDLAERFDFDGEHADSQT